MGVDIDEAGRKAKAVGLDDLRGVAMERGADFGNAAIVNSDVKQLRVVSAAVEHRRVADECVAIQHLG